MPLQNGAYLALSRKFLWTTEHGPNFSLVRQTRNTGAEPVAMIKPARLSVTKPGTMPSPMVPGVVLWRKFTAQVI